MSLSPIAAFARAHDPDRFLAALFAPPEKREAIFTLIDFNHELARAREVASHPMAALIRLQWWRDALEEARQAWPARRH
ncbi:MAG: squalene/phytoene synthase family protein, partial [Roseomonas sp.]|nr:squalene/phytoene synthase family protein [Roseomonas sp.]